MAQCCKLRSGLAFNSESDFALVAQWIEHGSPKAGVGGSIPLWGATIKVSYKGQHFNV